MYRIEYGPAGISVDGVFRDIYDSLEKLQEAKEQTEAISSFTVNCARELRNLERIHGLRWKFYGPASSEDPFDLYDMLKKFLSSCNAFFYVTSSSFELDGDNVRDGCLPVAPRKNWKKKHLKSLETEFYDHQRVLSLALSNAVYTTSLRMQRTGSSPDAVIAQVLAQSERRQYRLARVPARVKGNDKPIESNLEGMEWELCLRRYFEFVDSWLPGSSAYAESTGRRSPFTQPLNFSSMKRSPSIGSTVSDMKEDEMDTSVYYRKPKRRTSFSSRASSDDDNDKRSMSLRSNSTNALVPYSPTSGTITRPRPIRRTSITSDFHWEYIGKSCTLSALAPIAARYPDLKDAQVDIYTQTHNMTPSEARAYAQGRLAGLSPDIIDEVRRALSSFSIGPRQIADQDEEERRPSSHSHHSTKRLNSSPAPAEPSRSSTLDALERKSLKALLPPPDVTVTPIAKTDSTRTPPRSPQSPAVSRTFDPPPRLTARPKPKNSWKHPFLALAEMRPLTAISERPSTARTSRSKASSFDRPASRTSLVPSFRRKSNLSQQVLPPLPDGATEIIASSGLDQPAVDKSLPLPPQPNMSGLIAMLKQEGTAEGEDRLTDLPKPTSMISIARSKPSHESLRRVSMELLKRKDSKVALMAVAESLEVPFELWLRALPYIEGQMTSMKT